MEVDARHQANLMGMAGTAEAGGNREEALSYFNRVLEDDPTFSDAWLGKGRNAGWLSSLSNIRVNESIVAFGHAIATAPDEAKAATAERAQQDVVDIVAALGGMAERNFKQYSNTDIARKTYVSSSGVLIDALEASKAWNPNNRKVYDTEIAICRRMLDYGVAEPYATTMRTRLAKSTEELRRIDPEYAPPVGAGETFVAQQQRKANSDALGYIVAFAMVIIFIIVSAVNSSHR